MLKTRKSFLLGILLASLMTVAVGSATQASERTAIRRATKLISDKQERIGFAMHPTCKLQSIRVVDVWRVRGGGYRLDVRYSFKSLFGNPFTSTLNHYFDEDGDYQSCITDSTSGLVTPFTGANVAVSWFKGKMKNWKSVKENFALQRTIESTNARKLLDIYLKYSQP